MSASVGSSLQPIKKQRIQATNFEQPNTTLAPTSPLSLLRVRGISQVWNEGCFGVNLKELVKGDLQDVVVSDYMVDFGWVLSAFTDLKKCQRLLVVHGEKDASEIWKTANEAGLKNFKEFAPPLPIPFGTHHSKFFLVTFKNKKGLRLIIHTANMIYQDCNNKTQGVWYQDFPPKSASDDQNPSSSSAAQVTSEFEKDLLLYLSKLKLPKEEWSWVEKTVKTHDFRFARGNLVASVPGYHTGKEIDMFGHTGVRRILDGEVFDGKFAGVPIVCQFSSLGSLDEKWLFQEFLGSLSRGNCGPHSSPLGIPATKKMALVWPTVEEVRNSLEGWKAGYSIPGNSKNVSKPFLQELWHRFDGSKVGRQRAMPHIKTFARYQGRDLCWCIIGSHNLSKAAWGALQKQGKQIMIRSYELGVIVTPSSERRYINSEQYGYCCGLEQTRIQDQSCSEVKLRVFTGKQDQYEKACQSTSNETSEADNEVRNKICEGSCVIDIPLPYDVPPVPYGTQDVPWKVDGNYGGAVDIFGEQYGVPAKFYGNTEKND